MRHWRVSPTKPGPPLYRSAHAPPHIIGVRAHRSSRLVLHIRHEGGRGPAGAVTRFGRGSASELWPGVLTDFGLASVPQPTVALVSAGGLGVDWKARMELFE